MDVNIGIEYDMLYHTNIIDPDWIGGMSIPYACPNDLLFRKNTKSLDYVLNRQMGTTHPTRIETINRVYESVNSLGLNEKSKINRSQNHELPQIVGNSPHTPFDKWWDILEKSKIIVVERGTGIETYRFWESIDTGNYVLCTPINYYRENNTPLPNNVIFWYTYDDLYEKIKFLSKIDDSIVIKNRSLVKNFIKEHHLPKHRLDKIFKKINF